MGQNHGAGQYVLNVIIVETINGDGYINEVMLPHGRILHGVFGDIFPLINDNALCLSKTTVHNCLQSEVCQCLLGPSRFLSLNLNKKCLECFRATSCQSRTASNTQAHPYPCTKHELKYMHQKLLNHVLKSMPDVFTVALDFIV